MQNLDYANALRNYQTSQGFLQNAVAPTRNATIGSALARIITSYFANKGMGEGQHQMGVAKQGQQDQQKLDLSRALGAYRGDTAYEADLFPGEEPIEGLRNMGQGSDRMAMAQALMGANSPALQGAGLNALMQAPETPSAPKTTDVATGETDDKGNPYFQKSQWVNGRWEPMGNPYLKKGVSVSTNVNNIPKLGPGERYIRDEAGNIVGVGPKPSSTQSTAGNYASRMVGSESVLREVVGQGFDPTQFMEHIADKFGTLGNFMKSPEGQKYRQAQEDWVRAKLRKESGAVIADEEMEREIRVYFPQPGDGPDVLAQKEINRMRATNGMIKEADDAFDGQAYDIPDQIKYIDGQRFVRRGEKWFQE